MNMDYKSTFVSDQLLYLNFSWVKIHYRIAKFADFASTVIVPLESCEIIFGRNHWKIKTAHVLHYWPNLLCSSNVNPTGDSTIWMCMGKYGLLLVWMKIHAYWFSASGWILIVMSQSCKRGANTINLSQGQSKSNLWDQAVKDGYLQE